MRHASVLVSPRTLLFLALLAVASCSSDDGGSTGGGTGPGTGNPPTELLLNEVSNGFGQLLPHRVLRPGTADVVAIRSLADIRENVFRGNPILPTVTFPTAAITPDGTAGNHYLYASFSEAIDPLDVLTGTGNGLEGAITVTAIDSVTGATFEVPGRAFVGGQTVILESGQTTLQTWVTFDSGTGALVPNPAVPEAVGFPGVGSSLLNGETLVSSSTVVFVADDDADLATFDPFPGGVTIRFRASTALVAASGVPLREPLLASVTVGSDLQTPELQSTPPPVNAPLITPGNGDVDVPPDTHVRMEFTESVQPYSLGQIQGQGLPLPSSAVSLTAGPASGPITFPFTVRPVGPFDLTVYDLIPSFAFPGRGDEPLNCGGYSAVSVALAAGQVEDLSNRPDPASGGQSSGPNVNTRSVNTFFEIGEGVGIVNAPVAPDSIYVGRRGTIPGLSVLDLNGFGQSTGNPVSSTPYPLEGESRFPYDPNYLQNPTVRPLLTPGTCTIDGGSAGVFTLTLDSNLSSILAGAPTLSDVSDVHLAHALDAVFRNAPPPFGCASGGGNVCHLAGIKILSITTDPAAPSTIQPEVGALAGQFSPGYENLISWAPHPNPPRLTFPPLCLAPFLASSEPTSVDVLADGTGSNLLVPGNPFPDPVAETPPTGLLTLEQNQFFVGPSFGQTTSQLCRPFQIGQQLGHFLYVIDRPRSEVVVLNSNTMHVIGRIAVMDPVSMAVGPNLDLLAVTDQLADAVTLIDINPASAQFHEVIREVQVGNSPRGLAFEPTNEDLLVCNELGNSLSIISLGNLAVRKTVNLALDGPFELAVTPRMTAFSFQRDVYFSYLLDRAGACAVFESGPGGVNGWGFDTVIGTLPFQFQAPKAIQIDPLNLDASVYIAHEGPIDLSTGAPGSLGDGALSRLHLSSAQTGSVVLGQSSTPGLRDLVFEVAQSLGQGTGALSGIPVDLAFDNQRNLGGTRGPSSTFSAGVPIPGNHKATVRVETQIGSVPRNTSTPSFLFVAIPESLAPGGGVIDVLHLDVPGSPLFDTNPYADGVQSIPAPGVAVLSDYFRQ
ncbi:hypothetical protein Poly30_50830 [Planctomycetes bacterium Poly30]|uniref:SbsA Ig-like domain-containing protein n=1 Tax=Saltatorellus ferox TaxID=2528018 RepID=A0A518EZK4_9BACT|nr:hypothetical protein Poly30_50830 [Planctomycetes bacterium Poly30]